MPGMATGEQMLALSEASGAAIDDLYDYNRDGLVNGTDQIIARHAIRYAATCTPAHHEGNPHFRSIIA